MGLIEELKRGYIPSYLESISKEEGISQEKLVDSILAGTVVVPQNEKRKAIHHRAIGKGMSTKVNANIGTSRIFPSLDEELKKLEVAIQAGADTIMDLSTGGDLDKIRGEILKRCHLPLGTVPIYQVCVQCVQEGRNMAEMTVDELFGTIEKHAQDGVDFMTLHCGITEGMLGKLKKGIRILDVVSRGGSLIIGWMIYNQKENPLNQYFDRLLDILEAHDVTLSLGDGLRPGCLEDATDELQIAELVEIGRLVREARERGVQVMVEGPGHIPIQEIEANVKVAKKITDDAPLYVLGPLVTDIAPGYDHITSAIGGALAAAYGADFLCYVTPREHIGLPTVEDVRSGVIASRIAAHVGDLAKDYQRFKERDARISLARRNLDWEGQRKQSIDPDSFSRLRGERNVEGEESCSMCGEYCAIEIANRFIRGEI